MIAVPFSRRIGNGVNRGKETFPSDEDVIPLMVDKEREEKGDGGAWEGSAEKRNVQGTVAKRKRKKRGTAAPFHRQPVAVLMCALRRRTGAESPPDIRRPSITV